MNNAARNNYLQTEVLTATPQKLQLLLLDAAIRFAESARGHWQAGNDDAASEAIIRCQQIMGQLLGGLRPDRQPDLAQRVAAVYTFVFNCFVSANLHRDPKPLEDALSVLAVEQETWRQICAKLGSEHNGGDEAGEGLRLEG